MKKQRDRASPRAISQGWNAEADTNIKNTRKEITEKKLQVLFDTTLNLRFKSEQLLSKQQEIQRFEFECKQLENWRSEELMDLWARQAEQQWGSVAERKAKAIAEQRRRWRIKFYTPEGKPDLRRRDGYPWDPSVYAGPERDTAPSNLNDILSFCNGASRSDFGGKVKTLLDQLNVVNATAEKHRNEALVDPLLKVVQKTHDVIHRQGGHVNTPDELLVNREEVERTRNLERIVRETQEELKARTAEIEKAKEKAEFAQDASKREASHVPWELLDQLDAERKKLKAEKAMKLIFNK